ncbi:MAG: TonB-dependent receptor [Rariglobus sp.]
MSELRFNRLVSIVAASASALLASTSSTAAESRPAATDKDVVELDRLVVSETQATLAPTNVDAAEAAVGNISGGASLIRLDEVAQGRVSNTADALKFQSGVYAQSSDGGEATKISIRGSGLVRGAINFNGGIQVLLDGQPLSSLSGIPYESNEPLVANYIQVLRGANAFDYGPLSLGGTINYVTKTGYDEAPFQARLEAGSFGYFKGQVSSGYVAGPFDYYVSATRYEQEGYRDNSEADSTRFIFNAGYRFNDNVTTRFNYRFAKQNQETPGFLGWNVLQSDPTSSQFANVRERKNTGSNTVSNNTVFQIDADSRLEVGVQYKDYPVDNSLGSPAPILWSFSDISASVRYFQDHELFGRENKATLALLTMKQLTAEAYGLNGAGVNTYLTDYDALDVILLASNDLAVTDKLWLTTGIAAASQSREVDLVRPFTDNLKEDYFNLAPRVGLRYELNPKVQLYANVSQSVEAPTTLSYTRNNGANIPFAFLDVEEQTATTVEFGTRGESGRFKWDLSYYHAWVRNELLSVVIDPVLLTTATSNAEPTRHQGIEAALDTELWTSATASDAKGSRPERVVFRQVFTWSDFYYEGDSSSKLPGIPSNFYQADLTYEHSSGFYIGANIESSFSSYPVDFANSIYVPSYTIFGAKIGYTSPSRRWDIFFEARNLADERYAAAVSTVFNAGGNKNQPVYSPGVGRNFAGGVNFRF